MCCRVFRPWTARGLANVFTLSLVLCCSIGALALARNASSLLLFAFVLVLYIDRIALVSFSHHARALLVILRKPTYRRLYMRSICRGDPRAWPLYFVWDMVQRQHEGVDTALEPTNCGGFMVLLDKKIADSHAPDYDRIGSLETILLDGHHPLAGQIQIQPFQVPGVPWEVDTAGFPRPQFPGHCITVVRHSHDQFQILQCFIYRVSARYAQQQGWMGIITRRQMQQWVSEFREFVCRETWDVGTELLARRLFHAGCPHLMGGNLSPTLLRKELSISFTAVSQEQLRTVFMPFSDQQGTRQCA